jgi:PD-(D/E)XK nuclease superfamily
MRDSRLAAARARAHGQQVMTFEQAAVRLAGGFSQSIDPEALRTAVQKALSTVDMGELESIKLLPGMVTASVDTLRKVWYAGISLNAKAKGDPRMLAIAQLETAVLAILPRGMRRPMDIVAAAIVHLAHAPKVLGAVQVIGLTELEPCWRKLLMQLATQVPVQWIAGPRSVPAWLADSGVTVVRSEAQTPETQGFSAATAYHEAIEALRWARALLASGIDASQIAIATASPAEYDDHFLALRADANLDLHFVHGVRTVTTWEGQAAAALADIVARGLTRTRLRRLAIFCGKAKAFRALPDGWLRVVPQDAPMATKAAWERLFSGLKAEHWTDGTDHTGEFRAVVEQLIRGPEAAAELGEAFLEGRALGIWRKALLAGPATAIDATLANLKHDDGLEASVSVAWMPASALAASPRPYVRLIGLNSARWPRGISEDRLIPDHIIPTVEIDPLPVNLADRRDFQTILATTARQVVLSRARRDSEGRLLGRSPLLVGLGSETYLPRHAVPAHAFSETDRMMARPAEFAGEVQAQSATACWRNWHLSELTPNDGLVRPNHPLMLQILGRTQSASSLARLLRNPISYVWQYGFGWSEPESNEEPLVLEPLEFGNLVHAILDLALRDLEQSGGLASADEGSIQAAIERASAQIVVQWEGEHAVPPGLIWHKSLEEVRQTSLKSLLFRDTSLAGARSFGEVPFGGAAPKSSAAVPWDASVPVTIPGTDLHIKGYIDRLDVAGDGTQANVRDYKTGKAPKRAFRLNGGRELQRCLYAFAVKALLGDRIAISVSLFYPRADLDMRLDDPEAALAEITDYLRAARTSLAGGAAIPGPDTASEYDDFALALPANANATYRRRKEPAMLARLADLVPLWGAE